MQPLTDKTDQKYEDSFYESPLEAPQPNLTPVHGSVPMSGLPNTFLKSRGPHISVFRLNSKALLITVALLFGITLTGIGIAALNAPKPTGQPNSQYAVGNLPLNGVQGINDLIVSKAEQLTVNGVLQANNTIILNPSSAPTNAHAGQIYYDEVTNEPYYYNGIKFVSLNPSSNGIGTSIGGATGAIGLGQGLSIASNRLSLSDNAFNGLVTSISGTTNQIITSASRGDVKLSLPQDINTTSTPTFGGLTINGTSTVNGAHIVDGTSLVRSTVGHDSVTAFQVQNSSNSAVLSVDTAYSSIGINTVSPTAALEINGTAGPVGSDLVSNASFTSIAPVGSNLITNPAYTTVAPDGSELVTNGTFSGNTNGWTIGTDVAYGTNNVISTYNSGDPSLSTTFDTVAGKTYLIKFNVSSSNAPLNLRLDNNPNPNNTGPFNDGSYTESFLATFTGTDTIHFDDNNYTVGDTWTLDNVSIYERGGPVGWSLGSDVATGSHNVVSTYVGGNPSLSTTFNTVAGDTYAIKFNVSSSNSPMDIWLDNNPNPSNTGPFTDGSYTELFTASYTGTETIHFDDYNYTIGDTWKLDGVSVIDRGGPANWSLGGDVTVGSNNVTSTYNGNNPSLWTTFNTIAGSTYVVKFNVSNANAPMHFWLDNNPNPSNTGPFADGSYAEMFTANYTGTETIHFDDYNYTIGDTWTLDSVSIKVFNIAPALKVIGYDGNTWLSLGGDQLGNTALGDSAFQANTTGSANIATGYQALQNNTTGSANIATGYQALQANTTGNNNIALGYSTLQANTGGFDNIAVGNLSLGANVDGYENTAIGHNSLINNTTGNLNAAIGHSSLYSNTTGSFNTASGARSLMSNTTGSNNTALGYSAGSNITTGSNNVIIGQSVQAASSTADNQLQIGAGISGDLAIGTLAVKTVTNSANAFQVQDTANNNILSVDTAGIRVTIGTMGTPNGRLYVSGGLPASAIGTVATGTNPDAVVISGNYSYVVNASSNTLQVFNISNPAAPTSVGTVATGIGPTSVAISGSYAYVTNVNSTTLQVFNISNPAAPTSVGTVATGTNPVAVVISGQYAYVANEIYGSSQQFQVFDISNPAAPALFGHLDGGAYYPTSVAISGHYAYLTTLNGHLEIVDVSNPASPISVGDVLSTGGGLTSTNSPVIVGHYAYVTDAIGYLEIFDVSNPASPTSVGTVASANPNSVAVSGRYAYVATNTANTTLQVFDVSNPASPTSVGTVNIGAGPHMVVTSSHYVYVVNSSANTFQIFDLGGADLSVNKDAIIGGNLSVQAVLNIGSIGTPTGQLYVAGQVPTAATGAIATGAGPSNAVISGHYSYVVNSTDNTLQIFDITNPAAPISISTVATGANPNSVAISGHYAYVADWNANLLQIFDISNPVSPSVVGSIATGANPSSVVVSGNYAYVVGYNMWALQIYDVSNPASPYLKGTIGIPSTGISVAVSGKYAYVVGIASAILQVVDVSNPASPVLLGSVSTGSWPQKVAVSGKYAYVTNTFSASYQIFNISNPASPTLVKDINLGDSTNAIAISGHYAYVGAGALRIYDITDPSNPAYIGSISTNSRPTSVNISGRYAYVINGTANTLQIFDIGGTYTQALEAGSAAIGNLAITNDATIGGSLSLGTGLTVAGASLLDGDVGVNGSAVFKNKVDSAVALQIQNTAAAALFTADTSGSIITIAGTSAIFASLILDNTHFKSTQTTAPTIGTPSSCGTSPTAVMSAGSTDTAGSFTITYGTAPVGGDTCDTVVTFNKPYSAAPKSIIVNFTQAIGGANAQFEGYVSSSAASSFTFKEYPVDLSGLNHNAGDITSYYYWVIE